MLKCGDLRDGSVWGLFRAREVTPAKWQCLGAVSCPRDDRSWGGTMCGCCFVPARWPTLMWQLVGSTQCAWCDFWYHDNWPGALSIELTQLQVINEVLLFVYVYIFVVSIITVHSYDMSVQMIKYHSQTTPSAPVIRSGTLGQGWAPLTCGCWQINSILANIGRRNSIRILNQYPVPLLMKYMKTSIIY